MDIAHFARTRYTCKAFDPSRTIPAAQFAQLRSVLRDSPSSVNSQPWHFIVADNAAGKARVAKAAEGPFAYNAPKVLNASHVVVLCVREQLDDAHLTAVVEQEAADGRYATDEAKAGVDKTRRFYANYHRENLGDEGAWMEKQAYIALGALLLGAGTLEIDACPMEGLDMAALNQEFDLPAQGLRAVVAVALGYRSAEDFNARLPKSRLSEEVLFSQA